MPGKKNRTPIELQAPTEEEITDLIAPALAINHGYVVQGDPKAVSFRGRVVYWVVFLVWKRAFG